MTRTKLPPTVDLSRWIVSDPPRRQSESGPSHHLSSFEEMDVEDNEPRPAGRGPKRKKDAEKGEEDEGREEREDEQGFEKRKGETWNRQKPLRTGRFHNPKCERCERSGKSCEKQKTGVACYQCAVHRVRCVPKGESGEKRRNAPTRTLEEKSAPPLVPQPLSPKPAITIPKISPQSTQTRFVRDKNYYHESGDLAFIVEDILFKVNTRCFSNH